MSARPTRGSSTSATVARVTEVLFGQSYYLRFDPKLLQAAQPYPPLGSMIAAACLRRQGWDVALFDSMLAVSEDEWAAALDEHRPRVAVLFEDNFNYLSKMCLLRMREAAFRMIRMALGPRRMQVVVCGSDASDHFGQVPLTRAPSYVLLGEGEETLAGAGRPRFDESRRSKRSGADSFRDVVGLAFDDRGTDASTTVTARRAVDAGPRLACPSRPGTWWTSSATAACGRQHHGYYSMNMPSPPAAARTTATGAPSRSGDRPTTAAAPALDVADEMAFLDPQLRARPSSGSPTTSWALKPRLAGRASPTSSEARERQGCRSSASAGSTSCCATARSTPCAAPAPPPCGWVPSRARSGSSTPWTRVPAWSRSGRRGPPASRDAGIVRVGFFLQFGYPGEEEAEVEKPRCSLVRRLPCRRRSACPSPTPCPARGSTSMVRDQLGDKQQLGRLRRPRHDARRHLRLDGLLPAALHACSTKTSGARTSVQRSCSRNVRLPLADAGAERELRPASWRPSATTGPLCTLSSARARPAPRESAGRPAGQASLLESGMSAEDADRPSPQR